MREISVEYRDTKAKAENHGTTKTFTVSWSERLSVSDVMKIVGILPGDYEIIDITVE